MAKQKVIVLNDNNSHKVSKILCAFDFSDNLVAALQSAVRFANFFGAKLKVIHFLSTAHIAISASKQFCDKVKKVIYNELYIIGAYRPIDYEMDMCSAFL
ncbi:MAG: universal stress protein [Lentisphaerales bacterium]|nr:universal stress protein [Lentisphaerales bacterium]